MKKLLLSAAFIGSILTAQAQIGTGAFDDFNQVDPYSSGSAGAGIYWWEDATFPADYILSRTGTVLEVAVTKGTNYSVVGFGFGDSNGIEPGGTAYTLNISGDKTFKITASATVVPLDGLPVDVQITDKNDVTLQVVPAGGGVHNKTGFKATGTATEYTVDFTDAKAVTNWTCATWPTDCPTIDETGTANFDFANIKQIVFLISGGAIYDGTVTFENMTLGEEPATPGINLVTGFSSSSAVVSSKLYPNPAAEVANLEVTLKNASDVKVVVSDMMGKVVEEVSANNTSSVKETINVSNLNKGIYTVNYYVNGAAVKADKLVIR